MRKEKNIQGVYVIGEPKQGENLETFYQRVEEILRAGISLFQLRIKEERGDAETLAIARVLRQLTRKWQTLFIINDRPDLVLLAEADGLHLGPKDLPVEEARKIVGRKLIGLSNHNFEEIKANAQKDVDYFSIGPIYPTTSKKIPDPVVGVEMLERGLPFLAHRPVVAIGGITLEKLPDVLQTGVSCVGVIRDLMEDPHPYEKTLQYQKLFSSFLFSSCQNGVPTTGVLGTA